MGDNIGLLPPLDWLQATTGGYALCYPVSPEEGEGAQGAAPPPPADPNVGSDASKLNLWSISYRCGVHALLPDFALREKTLFLF
jgi:hypothetical protein